MDYIKGVLCQTFGCCEEYYVRYIYYRVIYIDMNIYILVVGQKYWNKAARNSEFLLFCILHTFDEMEQTSNVLLRGTTIFRVSQSFVTKRFTKSPVCFWRDENDGGKIFRNSIHQTAGVYCLDVPLSPISSTLQTTGCFPKHCWSSESEPS